MARILVIEDDEIVRGVIRRVLKAKGYEVEEAEDGKVGVEMYDKNSIDLVLTDIVMPNKEGLETIREIRQMNPEAKIIAISGGGRNTPFDYLNLAEKFGASESFEKPFEWDDLIASIARLLGDNGT